MQVFNMIRVINNILQEVISILAPEIVEDDMCTDSITSTTLHSYV